MTLRTNGWLRLLAMLAFAAIVLAACGGDDEGDTTNGDSEQSEDAGGDTGGDTGGGASIELSAADNSFNPAEISAPAGEEVTVAFTNDGNNPHTFSSTDAGFDSDTVESGGSADVTFTMPDEETQFICNVHGESMSGTLVPE
ncbi:MAG: cupredoxin domain-containing protein [Actinomycetota bacterium]